MNQTFVILQKTVPKTLKKLWVRLFPGGRTALDKRRLERLLRDEGLSKSTTLRLVRDYFAS